MLCAKTLQRNLISTQNSLQFANAPRNCQIRRQAAVDAHAKFADAAGRAKTTACLSTPLEGKEHGHTIAAILALHRVPRLAF